MNGARQPVQQEDWEENEFSIKKELRILSAYTLRNGNKIWIITEAQGDRASR